MASSGIIHMIVRRALHDPLTVRWYVRRVWLKNGSTWDRVVAQGEFQTSGGAQESVEIVRQALREALAQLG